MVSRKSPVFMEYDRDLRTSSLQVSRIFRRGLLRRNFGILESFGTAPITKAVYRSQNSTHASRSISSCVYFPWNSPSCHSSSFICLGVISQSTTCRRAPQP